MEDINKNSGIYQAKDEELLEEITQYRVAMIRARFKDGRIPMSDEEATSVDKLMSSLEKTINTKVQLGFRKAEVETESDAKSAFVDYIKGLAAERTNNHLLEESRDELIPVLDEVHSIIEVVPGETSMEHDELSIEEFIGNDDDEDYDDEEDEE